MSALRCNVCQSSQCDTVATLHSEVDQNEYQAIRCRTCGLVFASPLPSLSFEDLQHVYGETYTEGIREPIGNDRALDLLRTATGRQMDIVERYVKKGLALNVGAMNGAIQVLQERGWRLRIVEVSRYAAETARRRWGFDVTVSRVEDYDCLPDTFDFIKLGHVIEHLADPTLAMKGLYRILRPRGVILIDTDNATGLRTQIELTARGVLGEATAVRLVRKFTGKDLRKRYGRLIPPVHLYYFSESSLVRLLESVGFEVISVRKPAWGDKPWFPLADTSSLSVPEKAFIKLDQLGALLGSGDLISVLARKPG